MTTSAVKVLAQWIGYCGGTTTEKRQGVPTDIEHDEIWAICYTSDAHVIVRHGSARSKPVRSPQGTALKKPFKPFVASPENPVPLKELTDRLDSLEQAERAFQERVGEKTNPKRKGHQFHAIEFEQPPYYIESFVRYLGAKQRGEAQVPSPLPLRMQLETLATKGPGSLCERCGECHTVRIDLGEQVALEPSALLEVLGKSEAGQRWLTVPVLLEQDQVIEVQKNTFLGRIACPGASEGHFLRPPQPRN